MTATFLAPADLDALRTQDPDLLIVDVRLADDHAAAHLPGAHSNCVFEVDFAGRLDGLGAARDRAICVYGHDAVSAEAADAAAKLERAGFTRVHVLDGGLDAWREAGLPVEGTGQAPDFPGWPTGRFDLDPARCRVIWTGRNLLSRHWGEVAVAGGHVECTAEGLAGGVIELDMRRLSCADLEGNDLHRVLIAHLQSDDFFDAERWPTARYEIAAGRWLEDAGPGAPNLAVEGALTLRDETRPLGCVLTAGTAPDGTVCAQGTRAIDRTAWGVNYGSGRLYRRLAGHLVNDTIELELRLVLAPKEGETA
ncbi:MAG: YceI family protein [Candidatus Krumholzibacteriia bacterium]